MAKYDWQNLKKEYLLGDYKSVSEFLKEKKIPRNGSTQKNVKGWNEEKVQKECEKSSRVIEKVIEKESTKEANEKVNLKSTAEKLLNKINIAIEELDSDISKTIKKTKEIQYTKANKPKKEVINEYEKLEVYKSIINKSGLKQLTSALSDLNSILNQDEGKESKLDKFLNSLESIVKDDK